MKQEKNAIEAKLHFSQFKKKFFKNAPCYLSLHGVCEKKSIRSHTVPRNRLSLLAQEGHVTTFETQPDMFNPNLNQGFIDVGLNKASTFPGFCKEHDSSIFLEIDNPESELSEEKINLFPYRVLVQELYKKSHAVSMAESFVSSDKEIDSMRQTIVAGSMAGIADILQQLSEYSPDGKAKGDLCHYIEIDFEELLPYSFSSPKNLEIIERLGGKAGGASKDIDPLVSFTMLPAKKGSKLLITFPKSQSKNIAKLLKVFPKEKRKLANALLVFGIVQFENIFFSPKWIVQLSPEKRKWLQTLFYSTMGGGDTTVTPAFDLVSGKVKRVKTNCQIGRIWKTRLKM